jgi:proteasome lid subunit RPN8/RPN11
MKKLLAIFVLALLAFSACDLFEKEEKENEPPAEVNADTILDNQIYEQAVGSNDLETCDRILGETKKEECKDVVNAAVLTQKALEEMDDDVCDGIKLDRYKENCEALIADEENRLELAEKEAKASEEMLAIEQEAVDKGDYKICDKIEDQNKVYICRFNVIANKAISANDKTLCKEIGEENLIKECEKSF